MTTWLSQKKITRHKDEAEAHKCCKKCLNQTPSCTALVVATNSASMFDKTLHVYFLLAHETSLFSKKAYAEVDLWCSKWPTQSASV